MRPRPRQPRERVAPKGLGQQRSREPGVAGKRNKGEPARIDLDRARLNRLLSRERERPNQQRTPDQVRDGTPPSSTVLSTSAQRLPHGLNLFAANPRFHVSIASSFWSLNQYALPIS